MRCYECEKKLKLVETLMVCTCDHVFCSDHRSRARHNCCDKIASSSGSKPKLPVVADKLRERI